MKNWLRQNYLTILFGLFIAGYAFIFLINPQLGPTDDFVFLRTLQSGKPLLYYSQNFPYYDWLGFGRFSILTSMEYNLVGLFSNSVFWYFFYHAVQFIIFALILVKLLTRLFQNKTVVYVSSILVFLMPAFAISWFRLQLPERNVIFLLALLLLIYQIFLEKQKVIYLAAGILLANLTIYYKEISFIIIGAFAFSHLILAWKKSTIKNKVFDFLLLLSSAVYLILYYFLIYLHSTPLLLKAKPHNQLIAFFKNIINYAFFSDPILIVFIPLGLYRLYKIFIKKEAANPFFDSLIAGALAYAVSLFALNMYGPYYLLPIYIVAVPALIYYLKDYLSKNVVWKLLFGLMALMMIFNAVPSGIHYLTFNKYLPINFNKTLDFLIRDIKIKHSNDQANIFLDGVDLAAGRGTYFIFGEFLEYKGLGLTRFNLRSNVFTEHPEPLISKISPPSTVFNSDVPSEIKSGDYLVIPPQANTKNITNGYLNLLKNDYKLVFQTKSPLAFPNLNLKILIKYLISKRLSQNQKASGLITNENLVERSDYYVFVKK